jgi:alanine racemase
MNPVPRALIDLGAIRHNLGLVRRHAPKSRIWAVIKADAYGHGMEAVASSLKGAEGFAVARVAEGRRLRDHGVHKPILVLEGPIDATDLDAAQDAGLEIALHQAWQVDLIEAAARRRTPPAVRVWLKLDTGMHRIGILPGQLSPICARLRRLEPAVSIVGLMTHLANADDADDPLTAGQCETAAALARQLGLPLSIGNSAGILGHPTARTDWVRPGIMLYGGSPLLGRDAAALGLRPAMTLISRLMAIQPRDPGDPIGYGGTYRCPESMPVGVVAVGYGDGYPRHAPTGTPVLIRGQRAPIVGRVSMDMISVDLRGIPDAEVGDQVILWGRGLPVEDVAANVGTINYELLCRISPRVAVEHLNGDADSPCHEHKAR